MKQGIILAAGMGKRLGDISLETPKPLLPVAGKTLIQYMIDFVRGIGCERIIVVGGYQFPLLQKNVQGYATDVVLVNNPEYQLQNLVSFMRGLEQTQDDDLFVCNADYIFRDGTRNAVAHKMNDICVYSSFDLSGNADDVMKVAVDANGDMITMSKKLTEFNAIYTGMFFFPARQIGMIRSLTQEILNSCDKATTTVERLFSALREKGYPIKVEDVGGADWFEIDTPEEWMAAKQALEAK